MSTALAERGETKNDSAAQLVGRVAQVLNARELVINIGSDAGVTEGRRFKVLAEQAMDVTDPDTGEVLGTVDREKTRVEAVEVRPRISICRTYRIVGQPPYFQMAALINSLSDTRRPETLHVRDSTLPPPLPIEESYVQIKDRVVSVEE